MPDTHTDDRCAATRAAALQRAALLDAPAEENFDRLTRLAKAFFGVSAAALSVPRDESFFLKSAIGFPEPYATQRCVPKMHLSPCREVVESGRPVVIEDASGREDELETMLLLGFRSYVGIPLTNGEGIVVGSFCVLNHEPRVWSDEDIAHLSDLAASAMTEIDLRSAVAEAARTGSLLAGQKRILEMIARAAPLDDVLAAVATLIDQQASGVRSSVLLLEDGLLMRGAAPSLPETFNCQVHELPINPPIGPCGLAARDRGPVISADIEADPRWTSEFRDLARAHNLRSGWSIPIPSTDGSVLGTFAMYYNEPREPGPVEQQLIDVATHLTGIAIERARAEAALRERAEALALADQRKDEFLAVLAHELRNPLAAIRLALQLQQRKGGGENSRTHEILERQVQHLARLADDLLDVSRITRGKIELRTECLDLNQLVTEVTEDCRADIERQELVFELDVHQAPLYVDGDRTRLAQVTSNILHNAVKFTNRGGRIRVELREQSGYAAVIIEDNGVGISEDVLEHVFKPFTQVEQTLARSKGGLGLGLSLVASLVKMHRGEVTAESEGEGRGSRFTFTLPLTMASTEQVSVEYDDAGSSNNGGLRVLIIEDNVDTAAVLQELLSLDGYETKVAHSGPAGVEAAARFWPHAVVCDLGLPGMDGFAVATELRKQPASASARLIALSGYGQPEDRRRSLEHGFDLHLTKASDPAELLQALAALDLKLASPC
ncbi:signal transduction histidine kinase [Pseudomonas duriflava]|uniref:histidine kinase n=1 Tax=Pseudomonas duriflava TaxID=459528 RepID=A0A562Q8Z2_9PSED|nr:ATP-binding protein [Pseudomonas duriflava]TWI53189.1 signal transduction histidine kinase [Pseudomonas duriflava]